MDDTDPYCRQCGTAMERRLNVAGRCGECEDERRQEVNERMNRRWYGPRLEWLDFSSTTD